MQDEVLKLYEEGKLIIRAVDLPNLHVSNGFIKYDCSTWANEFALMMNKCFESVSSTLLVPNVGVKTYKNVGFLVNSDLAGVQHVSKTDSSSRGSHANGDFWASESDFSTLGELANYIKETNSTVMNEVNLSIPLESVMGLVQVKSGSDLNHLKKMLIVKECIYQVTGLDFDIYQYDMSKGSIEKIVLTDELMDEVGNIKGIDAINDYDYYTDYDFGISEGSINLSRQK